MELKQVIELRRSIRRYKPDPVPENYIEEIIEAARLAPSGGNLQPWRFVIVKSEDVRRQLVPHTFAFVAQAPVVIACCFDYSSMDGSARRGAELKESGAFKDIEKDPFLPKLYAKRFPALAGNKEALKAYLGINLAIAIEHMVLRAADLGLGTCWIMGFEQEDVEKILGLEEHVSVMALLPLGFPAQEPKARPRLSIKELIIKEL